MIASAVDECLLHGDKGASFVLLIKASELTRSDFALNTRVKHFFILVKTCFVIFLQIPQSSFLQHMLIEGVRLVSQL